MTRRCEWWPIQQMKLQPISYTLPLKSLNLEPTLLKEEIIHTALGAEGFDCGPHILTFPQSRNKSTELHVNPSDFNVELVRGKDKMNLFLCRDDTYKFSFPERHWIPWPILSFPVKQHSLISLQALGSMMASALSCTVKAKCTKLNPNDTEYLDISVIPVYFSWTLSI